MVRSSPPAIPAPPPALDRHYNGSQPLYQAWSSARHMHHGYFTWRGPWAHDAMLDAMVERVTRDLTLPRGGRVADLGCGYGSSARRLLAVRPDLVVDGFTVLPEQVAHMTADGVANLRPMLADYRSTGQADATYDDVYFLESIDYGSGPDKGDALGEAARILKPGGRLVVAGPFVMGPARGSSGWLVRQVQDAFAIDTFAEVGPFEQALVTHGFEVDRVEVANLRIAPTVFGGHLRALGLLLRRWRRGAGLSVDERRHLRGGLLGLWLGLCPWAFQFRIVTATRAQRP